MDSLREWQFRKALPVHPSVMVLGWGSILLSSSVFHFIEWASVFWSCRATDGRYRVCHVQGSTVRAATGGKAVISILTVEWSSRVRSLPSKPKQW